MKNGHTYCIDRLNLLRLILQWRALKSQDLKKNYPPSLLIKKGEQIRKLLFHVYFFMKDIFKEVN